jgi:hypothetical protein
MQQSIVKFYCFVVQTLLNMFRALYPSSGARHTAFAASGFRMNVKVEGVLFEFLGLFRIY